MGLIAAVETGGTKTMCAVAEVGSAHQLLTETRIPTTNPATTLGAVREFLIAHGPLARLAVASFGPLDTDPQSPRYGWITTTPKPGWANTDVAGALAGLVDEQIPFVTDVTGSLLGEQAIGALRGCADAAYITVGTGVGVGLMVRGKLVTGRASPEMGHIAVRRHRGDDYRGNCRFHGDCLEGLTCGPAVEARWGGPATGEQVDIIASYIAELCATLAMTTAPQRIVIGGGVSKTAGLMAAVRRLAAEQVNGYLGANHPIQHPASGYLVNPQLGDYSALHGALAMALR